MTKKKEKPLEEILACPFCGADKVEICRTNKNACWVTCAECGAESEHAKKRVDAIANWNRRYFERGLATVTWDDEVLDAVIP